MPYIDFTRPLSLALLLLLVPIVRWWKSSIADMPPLRRKAALAFRLVLVLSLIFALSGIRINLPKNQLSVLFVVDSSLSISPDNREWALKLIQESLRKKPPADQAGVILFGKDAYLEESLSEDPRLARFSTIADPGHTDISRAIQLASAVFPESTVKRIILITDGNENVGSSIEEATLNASRGVEIDCLPYPADKFLEVLVSGVETPPSVSKGAPFALKVELDSTQASSGTLSVFRNGRLIGRDRVELKEGKNLFTIAQQLDKPGNYAYQASIELEGDRFSHNNRGETLVMVSGEPKVLYLSSDPRQARLLGSALKGHRFSLNAGGLKELPSSLAEMSQYKAVIFDNVSGLLLSPSQMQMIESYVKDLGGGFVMVGGEHSFGAGGYYDTPVERILPVSLDIKKRKNLPSVAIVLCIDKSGSMSERTGTMDKMALARESAIATLELLQPSDKIGVVGFDHSAKWVSVLQYASDRKKLADEIASLRAGGGTSIYPALDSAHSALKGTQAVLKHVILLTDGRSEPGDFREITKRMTDDKITLSTIGVGKDADMPFLDELAKMGQGRFYYADEATMLPRIFVRETILAGRSAILEEPFQPVPATPAEFLSGIDTAKLPRLLGYVITTPKPLAHVSLQSHQEDPILAYWRTGLGKSVAFTSDDGLRWAKDWLQWKDYTRFWAQLVRWVAAESGSDRFNVSTEISPGQGRVIVEASDDDGNPLNFLDLSVRLTSPSGRSQDLPLSQSATGRYEGSFAATEVGTYLINLTEKEDGRVKPGKLQAFTIPYSPEYKRFGTNNYLIEKLTSATGGRVISPDHDFFKKTGRIAYYPRPAWAELLLLTLCLLPLDVALRRVYLPDGFHDKLKSIFAPQKRPAASPDAPLLITGALKARKDAVREKYSPGTGEESSLMQLKSRLKDSTSEKPFIPTLPDMPGAQLPQAPPRPAPAAAEDAAAQKPSAEQKSQTEDTLSRLKKVKNRPLKK